MDTELDEPTIHSFVIKIWLEEVDPENKSAVWRGRLTHVPSGKRYYFQTIDEMKRIVLTYIDLIDTW